VDAEVTPDDELRQAGDPVGWLLDVSHTLPPAELGDAVVRAITDFGATDACVYLVDHDQLRLHPYALAVADRPSFPIDDSPGGRAFAWERTQVEPHHGGVRLWVPLVDGTARLGVLSVDGPAAPDPDMAHTVEQVAGLAAELVISKGRYTDESELARRHRPMTLAAELQRSNLPPVALVTDAVAVAGVVQPAYSVAGDSFDYALNRDALHVAILDSVGHDLSSALISHLVQGSLRNSRRRALDLVAAYAEADAALGAQFPDLRFATSVFGELDVSSGRFRWISAGHPPPLVVRGQRVVGEAPTVPAVPIGLRYGKEPQVNEVALEPGDAVVLYTDGVTEGGVRGGERFGLERFVDVLDRVIVEGLPPAEVLRRLVTAVLDHTAHELHDDMCIVLLQRRDGLDPGRGDQR
jgi:serine phosphatase RsbU (regulator of sigma subunit)